MSLVNDMLRDLDERQRTEGRAYTTVANKPKSHWPRTIIILLLLCVIAVLALNYWPLLHRYWESMTQEVAPKSQSTLVNQPNPIVAAQPEEVIDNARPETTPLNQIRVINWTQTTSQHGVLTLWLDQVKPFVVYGKTSTSLDIALEETQLSSGLPDNLAPLLSTVEIVPQADKSRFRMVASEPVNFLIELKQKPARLMIEVQTAPKRDVTPSIGETTSAQEQAAKPIVDAPAIPEPSEAAKPAVSVTPQPTNASGVIGASTGAMQKSLKPQPTDAATVRQARRMLAKQEISQAQSLLRTFIERQPKSSWQSRYLLVQLLLATESYEEARTQLQPAPNNLSWALLRSRSHLQQGEATEAITLLRAFSEGVTRQDYLELLASAYQQTGQHDLAVQQYLSLLTLNAQEARWWVSMGVSLEHLGQQQKALEAYQSALAIPRQDRSLRQYAQSQIARLTQ